PLGWSSSRSLAVFPRTDQGIRGLGKAPGGAGNQRKGNLVMQRLLGTVVNFLRAEEGPTAVEYAVMLALIIVVCISAITLLGNNAKTTFTSVGSTIGASS